MYNIKKICSIINFCIIFSIWWNGLLSNVFYYLNNRYASFKVTTNTPNGKLMKLEELEKIKIKNK